MNAAEEVILALLETVVTSPEPGTGYVDPYQEGRRDALKEALAEIRRRASETGP